MKRAQLTKEENKELMNNQHKILFETKRVQTGKIMYITFSVFFNESKKLPKILFKFFYTQKDLQGFIYVIALYDFKHEKEYGLQDLQKIGLGSKKYSPLFCSILRKYVLRIDGI